MVTALYRRYRPDTFDEVIGQEHVTNPLKAALDNGRINHAYLFSGPRGCGKTTSARILARCLNCEQGPTSTPCGKCASCRDLATGGPGSLDVVEIDAASHNGVDDARDLRERAVYAPARDRYKIFILDEAHMVTPQGFNALLKLVEEPPEHVKFVFATTEPEKVIGTIRSRTHHYPFRLVPPEVLTNYLNELCQRENVPVGKGVLPLVVRAGGGSVRDTLSVLDQLMAGSTAEGIDYHTAVALLGYTPDSLLGDIVDAFCASDGAAVFRVIDRVVESGQDPRRFVEDLLERFRDLIVVSTAPQQAQAFLPEAPADLINRLVAQAGQYGPAELSRAADLLNAGLSEMSGATSPRLQLELICARILVPGVDNKRQAVVSRIERMERRIGMSASGTVPGGVSIPAAEVSAPQSAQAGSAQAGSPQGGSAQGGAAQGSAGGNTAAQGGAAQARTSPLDSFEDDYADFAREAEDLANLGDDEPAVAQERSAATQAQTGPPAPAQHGAPSAAGGQATPLIAGGQDSHGTPAGSRGAQQEQPDNQDQQRRPHSPHSRLQERGVPQSEQPQSGSQQGSAPQQTAQQSGGNAGTSAVGGDPIDAIRRAWPTILDAVGKKSKLVRAILSGNAIPQSFDAGALTLGFNNQGALSGFNRPGNDVLLSAAILDVLGIQATIRLGQAGADTAQLATHTSEPDAGYPANSYGRPPQDEPGYRGQSTGAEPQFQRPTREQVDAVVGPRAVDEEPVDRNKYWTAPGEADSQEGGHPASVDGQSPAQAADAQPQTEALPEPQRSESSQQHQHNSVPHFTDPFAEPAAVTEPENYTEQETSTAPEPHAEPETSAGRDAVDMPEVVVPPPADDDYLADDYSADNDYPADSTGNPAAADADDDLDFLGVYGDEDFNLEPDSAPGQPAAAESAPPANPFAHLAQRERRTRPAGTSDTDGPAENSSNQEPAANPADAWGAPSDTRWGSDANPDGTEDYENYNTDDDPEIDAAPNVGIDVLKQVLGGEIIEEFTE